MATKIIDNKPYSISEYLKKLRKYWFLVKVLALREIKIKYSRTILGVGWFFFQPLAVVLVYSVFFHNIIKIETNSIPYPAFVFSGLVLWYIFTGMAGKGTFALIESAELITKVSIPRFIILIAKLVPVIAECLVLLLLLFILLILNHQTFGWNALAALFYFIQISIFSLGVGIICSTVVVKYRDLAQVIPFLLNFGIWFTPVFYPVSLLPSPYQNLLKYLNPLSVSIEGLRSALFMNTGISSEAVLIFLFSLLFLFFAFYYFVKFEKRIVENL